MAQPTRDVQSLAGLFLTSGTLHLVRPQLFEPIVPRSLPSRRALVLASGIAEIACAAGLLHPRTRQAAGWASAVLLLAVLPANVQMTADARRRARRTGHRSRYLATLARLPLQAPMVHTALKATRGPKRA